MVFGTLKPSTVFSPHGVHSYTIGIFIDWLRLKQRKMIAEIQIITFDTLPQTPSSKLNKKFTPTVRLRWKLSTSGDRHHHKL
jgi:hypothetical protein